MFNSVPHSTTKWSPASPKRENQSSLSAPSFAFRLCAYITFDPHLCKPSPPSAGSTRRYHRSFANQPLSSSRKPPFVLDPLRPTCSAPPPLANLISPNRVRSRRPPSGISFRVCWANYTPAFYIRACRYFTIGQCGARSLPRTYRGARSQSVKIRIILLGEE